MTKDEFQNHVYLPCRGCPDHRLLSAFHCHWCAADKHDHVAANAAPSRRQANIGAGRPVQPRVSRHPAYKGFP
jgi:hypothetical protein